MKTQMFVVIDAPEGLDVCDVATDLACSHPYLDNCTVYTLDDLLADVRDGVVGPTWRDRAPSKDNAATDAAQETK